MMIVAVDFDGVLCKDRFPEIGEEDAVIVELVRRLIAADHEVILWTSRVGQRLAEALEWCAARGLEFCAVNENAPSNLERYGTDPRKVYADLYVDDRVPYWHRTLAIRELENVLGMGVLEREEFSDGR